jgi:hypothetical protein
VRITDIGFTGDAFDVFINGVKLLSTPGTTFIDGLTTSEPGTAFGDARWSSGELFLDARANPYLITIAVREDGGFGAGEGFLRADAAPLTQPGTVVPEPATVVLTGTGALLLAGVARRRRR